MYDVFTGGRGKQRHLPGEMKPTWCELQKDEPLAGFWMVDWSMFRTLVVAWEIPPFTHPYPSEGPFQGVGERGRLTSWFESSRKCQNPYAGYGKTSSGFLIEFFQHLPTFLSKNKPSQRWYSTCKSLHNCMFY